MTLLRERCWLWGHEPHVHDGIYNLPYPSRMTPVEGAHYLGVPNLFMVSYRNVPTPPFDQHLMAMSSLRQVVWSIVGDSSSDRTDLDEVLRLAAIYPNLTGAIMDDFFHDPDADGRMSRVTVDDLHAFRSRLRAVARPLDLYVVIYDLNLHLPVQPYLAVCDVLTFWTWKAEQLVHLDDNFARLEALAPDKRKLLGCYLWDYGNGRPMPLELMQHQCRRGAEWVREGRLDGLIFLANSALDQELETVAWLREWLA